MHPGALERAGLCGAGGLSGTSLGTVRIWTNVGGTGHPGQRSGPSKDQMVEINVCGEGLPT